MSEAELVTNIIGHASNHVTDEVKLRVVAYWSAVDAALGARIAQRPGKDTHAGVYKEAARVIESRSNRA